MSDERQTEAGEPAEGAEFDLPVPPEGESGERRLRRGIFGYRADDVEAAISSRDTTIRELRRDVTALWLAFGQHERTIRLLVEATEALGGPRLEPPGGRIHPDPDRGDAPAGPEPSRPQPGHPGEEPLAAEGIAEQLAGLDEVLAAIESATQSLEQAYADEIAAAETPATAEAADDGRTADAGESPGGGGSGEAERVAEAAGSPEAADTTQGERGADLGEDPTAADADRSPAGAEQRRGEPDDEESR